MTLYLIDVKSLVDMNDHIRWQTSKETGHISQWLVVLSRREASDRSWAGQVAIMPKWGIHRARFHFLIRRRSLSL